MKIETSLTPEQVKLAEKYFSIINTPASSFEEVLRREEVISEIINSKKASFFWDSAIPSQEAINEVNKVNGWSLSLTEDRDLCKTYALNYTHSFDKQLITETIIYLLLFEVGSIFPRAKILNFALLKTVDMTSFEPKLAFKVRLIPE